MFEGDAGCGTDVFELWNRASAALDDLALAGGGIGVGWPLCAFARLTIQKYYGDGPENADVEVVMTQSIPICTTGWILLPQRRDLGTLL
jgi:hypothetical protein